MTYIPKYAILTLQTQEVAESRKKHHLHPKARLTTEKESKGNPEKPIGHKPHKPDQQQHSVKANYPNRTPPLKHRIAIKKSLREDCPQPCPKEGYGEYFKKLKRRKEKQ